MKNKSLTCQPHLAQYAILRSLPSILARLLPCRGRYEFGVSLYRCRENSTNPPFFTKQTQFFPVFHSKMKILQKNKPNQSQYKPNNESKIKGAKPIQTQTNPISSALRIPKTLFIDDCFKPAYNDSEIF